MFSFHSLLPQGLSFDIYFNWVGTLQWSHFNFWLLCTKITSKLFDFPYLFKCSNVGTFVCSVRKRRAVFFFSIYFKVKNCYHCSQQSISHKCGLSWLWGSQNYFDMFILCTQFSILCSKSMKWKHIWVWLLYLKNLCAPNYDCAYLIKLDVSPSQYYKHAFIFDVRVSRLEKPRDVFDVPSFYLTQAPFSSFFSLSFLLTHILHMYANDMIQSNQGFH